MGEIEFKTPMEMIAFLIDHEDTELKDLYGRKWVYNNFRFYYKEIGDNEKYTEGLKSVHLFGTPMKYN